MQEMKKPVLVIMAAGMGSRYGGLKQLDPMDEDGHIIMDYSVFDAKRAGFEKVIFLIRHEVEEEFRERIGNRISQYIDVAYAYQELCNIPEGFEVPEGRVKPWGTAHAILSCKEQINGSFAVINADDYYGTEAFQLIYDFLVQEEKQEKGCYAMVGYQLKNTITENGYVSRGICTLNDRKELKAIKEQTRIEKHGERIEYSEDGGHTWIPAAGDTIVSMNLWGFTEQFLGEIEQGFCDFLRTGLNENPLKCEYYLPSVVENVLKKKKSRVQVLESADKWYGVTYKEDKPEIVKAFQKMKEEGKYPRHLWEGAE